MSDFLVELSAGVIATLLGVWLGRNSNGPGPTVENSGGVVEGRLVVDQSRRSSRRVHVEIHTTRMAPASSPSGAEDENDLGKLVLVAGAGLVAMLALAFGYLLARDPALLVFRVASTFLVVFSLALLAQSLVWKRNDRRLLAGITVAGSSAVITLQNRAWLADTDMFGDRLQRLFESDIKLSFGDLLDYLTWDEVRLLAFQGLGLLLTGFLLLHTTWICFVLVKAVRRDPHRAFAFSWSTSRKLVHGFVWALVAVLSMLCCSGWLSAPTNPLGSAENDQAPAVQLEASVKLSPSNPDANLLCVRVTGNDDQLRWAQVSLERKVRRNSTTRWREIGAPSELSGNDTTCREVLSEASQDTYRFSLLNDDRAFHSQPFVVVYLTTTNE